MKEYIIPDEEYMTSLQEIAIKNKLKAGDILILPRVDDTEFGREMKFELQPSGSVIRLESQKVDN